MVKVNTLFRELPVKDKVEFFVQCQRILIENHPSSPFVCRANNLEQRLSHMRGFINQYKGFVYTDENVCTIYNKIVVNDVHDPTASVKAYMYQPPDPNFNAIMIDFVVFRNIKDCLAFVKTNYDPRIQYVLFVRHNKVKLYPVVKLLAGVLDMPIV